ncbi:spermidine coumaroyl-CoA acyltransferase-like [Trifolium pratense]|uniref:spermidine coumaroyl-CoA acyltransferase-like n=1 Tax=Trifolium pratense TaxID=57577 RepID=UPI001E6908E5|nr:spermidine coumaroyl-CoA acyltransferase-like [Trifolium pratense]
MAYEKVTLNLKMKDVELVKPSKFTPPCILSLSTLDNRGIYNNHCQTVHVYRSSATRDSDSSFDLCHVFKEALSKALFYYYPLAGKLVKHADDGILRVNCNPNAENYGVPFLEAIANCTLSSINYLDNTNTEIAKHLLLIPQDLSYPLVFKVTKFLCGGFTIGMGVLHAVCDGFGASQFFNTIVELARGRIEPSVIPVWERERLVGSITKQPFPLFPMRKESIAFSPFLNQTNSTNIKQYCFKVEGEMITKLKLSLMKESENENIRFTTFESLAAYIWRSRARALKLNNNGDTMLTVLVGMRRNLKDFDPIPKGFYGNSVMEANIVLKVSDLNEMSLYEIVKLIKEAKNVASTADYVKNTIDSLETNFKDPVNMEKSTGAVTVLTEWKHLGFMGENVDFGGNEIVNLVPAPCKMFASIEISVLSSSNKFDDVVPSMKGGVNLFTSLPVAAMPKFKEEIEALRTLSVEI